MSRLGSLRRLCFGEKGDDGAAGVIHLADSATTDSQPNDNVDALRVFLDEAGIEARPVWKPMHKQPVYKGVPSYVNGVSEAVFKVGM